MNTLKFIPLEERIVLDAVAAAAIAYMFTGYPREHVQA